MLCKFKQFIPYTGLPIKNETSETIGWYRFRIFSYIYGPLHVFFM